MSLEKNKDVIRRHYEELFNGRRLDRPDAVEGLKETVRWLTGAFPDLRIEINDLVAEGDKVLAYITMRGTHEGEFQGIPPSGRSFEAKAMHLFRLRDGKAVEHWAVREDLPMLLQLGLHVVPTD